MEGIITSGDMSALPGGVIEGLKFKREWIIEKYRDDSAFEKGVYYSKERFDGNVILDEGAALLLDLLIGAGGTVWNNANSYLGVGDDNTAEDAAHTGLQAAINQLYKAMEATFPSRASRVITWKAIFGSADANFAWEEFSLSNNVGGDSGTNMNRKVSAKGTKVSGETWTLYFKLTSI